VPNPTLDDNFYVINRDLDCSGWMDFYGDYSKQKATVWAMNVLEGEDQLCQHMAWSLYELLNVGPCYWHELTLACGSVLLTTCVFQIKCRCRF
jgi:hypothetical protein